jgi:hypothetical protein
MRMTALTFVWILALGLALGGCASMGRPAAVGGPADRQRNEGYSLLYKLMTDEAGVSDILIIKHADESVSGLVKEIATACGTAKARMEAFAKIDHGLDFNVADLPAVEQKSRDLESGFQEHSLLGSSGSEFQVRLIVTQVEAMGYGADLAKALEAHEPDAGRKAFLAGLAAQCEGFRERLLKLLSSSSVRAA